MAAPEKMSQPAPCLIAHQMSPRPTPLASPLVAPRAVATGSPLASTAMMPGVQAYLAQARTPGQPALSSPRAGLRTVRAEGRSPSPTARGTYAAAPREAQHTGIALAKHVPLQGAAPAAAQQLQSLRPGGGGQAVMQVSQGVATSPASAKRTSASMQSPSSLHGSSAALRWGGSDGFAAGQPARASIGSPSVLKHPAPAPAQAAAAKPAGCPSMPAGIPVSVASVGGPSASPSAGLRMTVPAGHASTPGVPHGVASMGGAASPAHQSRNMVMSPSHAKRLSMSESLTRMDALTRSDYTPRAPPPVVQQHAVGAGGASLAHNGVQQHPAATPRQAMYTPTVSNPISKHAPQTANEPQARGASGLALAGQKPGWAPEASQAAASDEISEADLRRACRALRLFFSGAQVRAIAAAPPAHYASIPIATGDPAQPPTALAKSLRLALDLLSQDTAKGNQFRGRLLLALGADGLDGDCQDPAVQALSSSIEAQIFGMNGTPEAELAAFASLKVPIGFNGPLADSVLDGSLGQMSKTAGSSPGRRTFGSSLCSLAAAGSAGGKSPATAGRPAEPAENVGLSLASTAGSIRCEAPRSESDATDITGSAQTDGSTRLPQDSLAGPRGAGADAAAGLAAAARKQREASAPPAPACPESFGCSVGVSEASLPLSLPETSAELSRGPRNAQGRKSSPARSPSQDGGRPLWASVPPALGHSKLPQWPDMKGTEGDGTSRGRSAGAGPPVCGSPTAGQRSCVDGNAMIAWQRLHASVSPPPHERDAAPTEERPLGARRDRESSPAANARLASPLRVMGGSGSGWQLAQWPREAPSRLRPSSRTSPHRRDRASRAGAPAPGSPQNQDAAGRSPLKQERLRRRDAGAREEEGEGRQAAALPSRRDRDSCRRAVEAQFQGGDCPGRCSIHPLDFYAVGKLLGKGAFGKVNIGVHKMTEELTAMKLCERKRIAEAQAKKCLGQEVSILRKLNGHANIIQLYEVIETSSIVVLVMEFAAGGDLLRYVRQRRRLSEQRAQGFFKQLADGVGHIHGMGIVHRDVKLENLLIDAHGCIKIADFGVASAVKPGKQLHEHCGTPSYIAPEILMEHGYEGQPVDVWSSGIVLFAMLCGRVPFRGESLGDLKRSIMRGKFQLPAHVSEGAGEVVKGILVVDPQRRATLTEVKQTAWMDGVTNCAEEIYGSALAAARCVEGSAAEEVLSQVMSLGYPRNYVQESLREGKLNHAAATFHLLAQQGVRRRAAVLVQAPGSPTAGEAAAAREEEAPAEER